MSARSWAACSWKSGLLHPLLSARRCGLFSPGTQSLNARRGIGARRPGADSANSVPSAAGEFYYFEEPNVSATETVAWYLQALESRLADAEMRFSA